jgi:ketosteroid isomerase-like protein
VSPEETAVVAANRDFYQALEARDLSAMEIVWAHDPSASCVHPGWHRLDGWAEIRRSWQSIFASSRPWTVACEDVRVLVVGELACVRCVEVITPFGGEAGDAARMQATNLFLRSDDGWQMVHHHASPTPRSEAEDEKEESVN